MNKKLAIKRSDNRNTRFAKKRFNNRIRRKIKNKYTKPYYYDEDSNLENTYKHSSVTYENEIERFCSKNNIEKWPQSKNVITFEDNF